MGAFILLAGCEMVSLVCIAVKASSSMNINRANISAFAVSSERHLWYRYSTRARMRTLLGFKGFVLVELIICLSGDRRPEHHRTPENLAIKGRIILVPAPETVGGLVK
jgi:hypothetical protein